MSKPTPEQITSVKGKGFLLNRGTDCFSGRIVPAGCILSAEDLRVISEMADRFGNGTVAFTSRLTAEIVGIPFERIEEAIEYAEQRNLYFGGTGAKIRPVTACKGTTCVYGNCDTQGLAREIHERYYIGWADVKLPHKFKIAVGGCPNSCMKPSLNDFGIEGRRVPQFEQEACRSCKVCLVERACPVQAATMNDGGFSIDRDACTNCGVCIGKCPFQAVGVRDDVRYQIFVGGTWGKKTRNGTPLSNLITEDEIFPILEKTMLWYKENAYQKERLGMAIDRLGLQKLETALSSDNLLERKDEILAAPLKTREGQNP